MWNQGTILKEEYRNVCLAIKTVTVLTYSFKKIKKYFQWSVFDYFHCRVLCSPHNPLNAATGVHSGPIHFFMVPILLSKISKELKMATVFMAIDVTSIVTRWTYVGLRRVNPTASQNIFNKMYFHWCSFFKARDIAWKHHQFQESFQWKGFWGLGSLIIYDQR